MAKFDEIPQEIFELFSALYPDFAQILDDCGLNLADFFLLSYIKHFGIPFIDGQVIILRSMLGEALDKTLSGAGVSTRIKILEGRNFLSRTHLKAEEKEKLFGDGRGSTNIVILRRDGIEKLDEFNRRINQLFHSITPRTSQKIKRAFLVGARLVATKALQHITQHRAITSVKPSH